MLLTLGSTAACAERGAAPTWEVPLAVEYAGCEKVPVSGLEPVCVLSGDRLLRLWIPATNPGEVEIRLGGRLAELVGVPVAGGLRYEPKVQEGATRIDVRVESGAGFGRWSLTLAASGVAAAGKGREIAAPRDLLEAAGKESNRRLSGLISKYDFVGAHEALTALGPPPRSPVELEYTVAFFRGQLARMEGDYRAALPQVRRAAEVARRVGNDREAWLAEQERGLLLMAMGRTREAALLFATLSDLPDGAKPCEDADLANNRAWALLLTREADSAWPSEPIGLLDWVKLQYDRCGSEKKTRRPFDRERLNVRLNLALAYLQAGRLLPAKRSLEEARELAGWATLLERLWWLDLEARIALEEGKARDALQGFEHLEQVALAAGSIDGRLRAALGKARAFKALGDRRAAQVALLGAEDILDSQSLRIPIQAGRETFVLRRQALTNLLVDLLLASGHAPDALAAARRGRSRVLRQFAVGERLSSLDSERRKAWSLSLGEFQVARDRLDAEAKDDWRLPLDRLQQVRERRRRDLEGLEEKLDGLFSLLDQAGTSSEAIPQPADGELLLSYHPLPHGWVAFAAGGGRVDAVRFQLPEGVNRPSELTAKLLAPFRARIERAHRVRILPYGPLRGVDFHSLPFAGDILMASRPVVYGLDLPTRAGPSIPTRLRALVVADPSGDLPGTREEAVVVGEALRDKGWTVTDLVAESAVREAVGTALTAADLLHFAGHGSFGGFGGWDSDLRLARETRLALGDLLTLAPVPSWVVLSGCETGRSGAEAPVEGLGLAHAFLLAGSQAVIASTRPVQDRKTLPFFRELYRRWEAGDDLAVAFQEAQLAWRREAPDGDWASFRLFVP